METYQKQAFLQALGQSGQCEIDVYGTSMQPFIQSGDRILVSLPDPKPRIGQIVGVFAENHLIVHRIVFHRSRSGRTRVWIRGDSLPHSLVCLDYKEVCCTVRRLATNRKTVMGAGPVLVITALLRSYAAWFRYRLSQVR